MRSQRRSATFVLVAIAIAVFATPMSGAHAAAWPLKSGSHQMLQGFGDGSPNSVYDFHEGIDIFATGTQDIVAVRAGKVVREDAANAGTLVIEVDLGAGKKEYDVYLHAQDRQVALNANVLQGAVIAKKLADFGDSGKSDHLHFAVAKVPFTAADNSAAGIKAFEKNWLNPFARFTNNADKDPLGQKPALADTNGDGKKLLIAKSGKTTPPGNLELFPKQTIAGDADIIADVRDKMHDTFLGASGPHKIGYHVKALFDQGVPKHDVRTAADPYLLAKFDDDWFAGEPFKNGKFTAVYADDGKGTGTDLDGNAEGGSKTQDLRVKPNDTLFPLTRHYVVTNTKSNDGKPANVDAGQYWNTNAKDDPVIPDTHAEANFATKADTDRNAKARFKDGEYEVHIVLGDLVNTNEDATGGKLRLNNFEQKAGAGHGGRAPAPGPTPPLYAPDATPYVPDFIPDPSFAHPGPAFFLGDLVGIFGDQYYPDLVMPAYVFHHHPSWLEDDPLTGFIARTQVLSDDDGMAPLTFAWIADEIGLFDVIIDYDRDGLFTWTMDGLGAFIVTPAPPSVWLLVAAAAGVACWRRRAGRRAAR